MRRLFTDENFIAIIYSIISLLISLPIIILMCLALIKYIWG